MVATSQRIRMLPDREQAIAMNYEDFRVQIEEGAHAEWVNGEAIVFMPPNVKHQSVAGLLYWLIVGFVDLFDLGRVWAAPLEMRAIPDGPAREPDIIFVAKEHLARLTDQRLVGPADLAIEIISDESAARDRSDKFYEYEEAGIREYWLFDPRPRRERADFHRLNAEGKYDPIPLDMERQFHSAILPGFWLKPEWFWQDPLPSPFSLLTAIAPQAVQVRRPAEETA
jgi:Uma2 family endonuclease